jgi:hypothetical protein
VFDFLESLALVGFYHTVSFFANGLRLAAEPYAVAPPALTCDQERIACSAAHSNAVQYER